MQRLSREHVQRVLDEQERLNEDLEKRRKNVDSWSKELNKREALTEREKQKLDEEKRKNELQNTSLHMASEEQKKADESVLRLVEELKREKEEALKKLLELETQLYAKHKLEMEIEELKGKVQVMSHLGDDTKVQEEIKKMNDELEAKMEEMGSIEDLNQTLLMKDRQSNDELQEARKELIKIQEEIKKMNHELEAKMGSIEDLNQTLLMKERQSNDELQEARKELIKGVQDMLSGRTNIGVKRMGEVDMKTFHDACKERFGYEEAQIKASELCTLWQDKLKDAGWHPLKVVIVDGEPMEVINEDDELLKGLKAEWGAGIHDAVVAAFLELHEYNASGSYVVSELWNFKDNRKATLKEVISYILEEFEEP